MLTKCIHRAEACVWYEKLLLLKLILFFFVSIEKSWFLNEFKMENCYKVFCSVYVKMKKIGIKLVFYV